MKKDIDLLKKRNRKRRDLMERAGSTGLALSGFIGLMFLSVLVWQIAVPTFIEGETGQIEPCLLYTSPSPRDRTRSRMPSSA